MTSTGRGKTAGRVGIGDAARDLAGHATRCAMMTTKIEKQIGLKLENNLRPFSRHLELRD